MVTLEYIMPQRRIINVDAFTNEKLSDSFLVLVKAKRKNGFKNGWIAMDQNKALMRFALSDLKNNDRKVWAILLANVDYENHIHKTQMEMADELGMTRQAFWRSVDALVAEGIILKTQRQGRNQSLKLNPEYGWKGSTANHIVALDSFRKKEPA
jgi:biotin operon repressor